MSDINDPSFEEKQEAKRLSENPAFMLAVRQLRELYIEGWRSTPVSDVAVRERYYVCVNVIDDIAGQLDLMHKQGKIDQRIAEKTARGKGANA